MTLNLTSTESTALRKQLAEKFHPRRHPKMPQVLGAILGYVIDARLITPSIGQIEVQKDGSVIATIYGQPPVALCDYRNLVIAWLRLIAASPLTLQERVEAE